MAPENIVAVTLAGVLGSVLPDIDLKDSRPAAPCSPGSRVFFSFAVLFSLERKYSIAEMLILWLGTLVAVRYRRATRSSTASATTAASGIRCWPALFCAFLTALRSTPTCCGRDEGVAWLAGGFMLIGYLTHLILDEIYSVDVMDTRIKASFGTALKLDRSAASAGTTAMAVPPCSRSCWRRRCKLFVDGVIIDAGLWSSLQQRLLPQDNWFGVDWRGTAWRPATCRSAHGRPAGDRHRREGDRYDRIDRRRPSAPAAEPAKAK